MDVALKIMESFEKQIESVFPSGIPRWSNESDA